MGCEHWPWVIVESDTPAQHLIQDPLEEQTATHFSTVAWETPWTEESGRLQSMGLKDSQT